MMEAKRAKVGGSLGHRGEGMIREKGGRRTGARQQGKKTFLEGVHVVLSKSACESAAHARRRTAVITKAGGTCTLEPTDQTNVVLCGEATTKAEVRERIQQGKDLEGKLPPSHTHWITAAWLTDCLKAKDCLPFDCYLLRGGETPAPSSASSPTRPAASHRAESAKPSLLRHSSSVSSTSSRTAQPWDDDNGSGSGVQLGASEGTPFNAPSSQAPDAGEGGEGKKCGKQSTVHQEGAPDTAATAAKAEAGEALVARSRRVVGTSPEEIDLPPGWDAVYFCYNCGSKEHGAMHCPRPPRGTPENTYVPPFPGARRRVSSEWVCARPHGHKSSKAAGPNDHIVAKLEQLHDTYADYGTSLHDLKAMQLSKALTFLRRLQAPITSYEQARRVPNVGKGTAKKIEEILNTGTLERLEAMDAPEKRAQHEFSQIYGVGATTAKQFVAKGYRSIQDLLRNQHELTERQRVGVQLYQEFQQRIPRGEVDQMVAHVKRCVLELEPECIFEACGSYRRGKKSCGDVDFLISHRDPRIRQGLFKRVIAALHHDGFLTHDLACSEGESNQLKYMGVGRLKGSPVHRRVDIIVVPWEEWPCALLYFTGSGHFNRSMRLLARKASWSLSQHTINYGVVRDMKEKAKKLGDGTVIPVKSEHDVFALLALKYRPPWHRNA